MFRVLLVDDNEQFRGMLRRMLEREGYEVREAINGSEGLRLHRSEPSDLVILDILMPEQDGFETLAALSGEEHPPGVICVSGGGNLGPVDLLKSARALGASRTLMKPFERAELLDAVREVLEGERKS